MTNQEVVDLLRGAVNDAITALDRHLPEREWAAIRQEQLREAMERAEQAIFHRSITRGSYLKEKART